MHLLASLTPQLQSILKQAATVAESHNTRLWLVGGVVRDMLLHLPIERDIDLVIEGDAIALAHSLAPILNGAVVASHQPFGTATIAIPHAPPLHTSHGQEPENGYIHLDLATARTEYYPHPASLPIVQPATIAEDLARRDFSINAMAIDICATADGEITTTTFLDPFNGQHDVRERVLRALHNESFTDDPTRILRGVRLMSRLEGHIEPHTASLLHIAFEQQRLQHTSPDRIRTELCLALQEPRPDEVLRIADELAVTPHIFPALHWSDTLATRCTCAAHRIASANQSIAQAHLTQSFIGLLTYDFTQAERQALIQRYRLPGDAARLLREVDNIRAIVAELSSPGLRHSELDRLLSRYGQSTLTVVACAEPAPIPEHIAHYQTIRTVTPLLDGHALQRLGVAPGPQLGQLLRQLRAAKLDGLLPTYADEEAWVLNRLPLT